MLALSIRHPWAWAIIHAPEPKDTENRTRIGTWERGVGQRIAIHSSKRDRWDAVGARDERIVRAFSQAHDLTDSLVPHERDGEFVFGAVIGSVYFAGVHVAERDCCPEWGNNPTAMSIDPVVHLDFDHPRPCDPMPWRGALGLWTVPAHVAEQLEPVRR